MEAIQPFLGWLHEHLLSIVFLVSLIDATGLPFPGRAMLVAAGMATAGPRDVVLLIATSVTGSLVGDHILYALGMGKVLRFGAYSQEVLDRLRWMNGALAPALARALDTRGPLDLKNLTAQALQMGDECHNRNVAASSLFVRTVAPALVRTSAPEVAATVLEFLEVNNHFYLNLSMSPSSRAPSRPWVCGVRGSVTTT